MKLCTGAVILRGGVAKGIHHTYQVIGSEALHVHKDFGMRGKKTNLC